MTDVFIDSEMSSLRQTSDQAAHPSEENADQDFSDSELPALVHYLDGIQLVSEAGIEENTGQNPNHHKLNWTSENLHELCFPKPDLHHSTFSAYWKSLSEEHRLHCKANSGKLASFLWGYSGDDVELCLNWAGCPSDSTMAQTLIEVAGPSIKNGGDFDTRVQIIHTCLRFTEPDV